MSLVIKKRGRPTKEVVAQREALEAAVIARANRPDAEILKDLTARFDMLSRLTRASLEQNVRSFVVSGAAGIGKSYNVQKVLENTEDAKYSVTHGTLSAINLYMLAYEFRNEGDVIVLDDADGIFQDEDALNILKALCDSSPTRRVSYLKEANVLKEREIPQTFEFHGAFIFISNQDFQSIVDDGGNKLVPHFAALMSRSLYLDLQVHNRRSLSLWVNYIAREGRLFDRERVDPATGDKILNFITQHRDDLRELSVRTLVKMCELFRASPLKWEDDAKMLLLRPVKF